MMVWGIGLVIVAIAVTTYIQVLIGASWWLNFLAAAIRTPPLLLAVFGFMRWRIDRERPKAPDETDRH